jgi:DNA-binding protein HU-beta
MNRTTLAAEVAARSNISKLAAERAVEAILQSITHSLSQGENVSLAGFGSFQLQLRAARTVINPRTKAVVKVAPAVVPKFKPGSNLRLAVEIAYRDGVTAEPEVEEG